MAEVYPNIGQSVLEYDTEQEDRIAEIFAIPKVLVTSKVEPDVQVVHWDKEMEE